LSDPEPESRSKWGGGARLPLVLAGLLMVFAVALLTLVVIGAGTEDTQSAQADSSGDPEQADADATPPPEAAPPEPTPVQTSDQSANDGATPSPAATAPPMHDPGDMHDPIDTTPTRPRDTEVSPQVAALSRPPAVATGHGILTPAPDPALIEQTSIGPLPRVGDDGRLPWQAYARPFDNRTTRPRIALIITGLGLSDQATQSAIKDLPGEVSLAFQPFAENLQQSIRQARAAGHEVYLNLPMEPVDFPASDPGPRALFVAYAPEENIERLEWALSRTSGYVGLLNHMGSRFTTSREAMLPVMTTLQLRGLAFIDARVSARSVATVLASEQSVPRAINDRFLDAREVSSGTVDARLAELESIAGEAGASVGIGQAFPVTIERIQAWAASLNGKGLVLAPVSAVLDRQADR